VVLLWTGGSFNLLQLKKRKITFYLFDSVICFCNLTSLLLQSTSSAIKNDYSPPVNLLQTNLINHLYTSYVHISTTVNTLPICIFLLPSSWGAAESDALLPAKYTQTICTQTFHEYKTDFFCLTHAFIFVWMVSLWRGLGRIPRCDFLLAEEKNHFFSLPIILYVYNWGSVSF